MRKFFIIYMGKPLEKLILILGMIVLGSITLAQSPVDTLSGDNTPIIERKRKAPKVEKEIKQKPETPKQEEQTKNKPTQKSKKKTQQKPQFLGLKIYNNDKPKQPAGGNTYYCGECYSVKIGTFRCKDWEVYYTGGRWVESRKHSSFKTYEEKRRFFREIRRRNKNVKMPLNTLDYDSCEELLKELNTRRLKPLKQ